MSIRLSLTRDQAELLLPILESSFKMDRDDPELAPPNAAKNWKAMVVKLKKAMKRRKNVTASKNIN